MKTLTIYLYFDIDLKDSALRRSKKLQKQGYKLTKETDCLILTKEL
jgi:hypothetical protein